MANGKRARVDVRSRVAASTRNRDRARIVERCSIQRRRRGIEGDRVGGTRARLSRRRDVALTRRIVRGKSARKGSCDASRTPSCSSSSARPLSSFLVSFRCSRVSRSRVGRSLAPLSLSIPRALRQTRAESCSRRGSDSISAQSLLVCTSRRTTYGRSSLAMRRVFPNGRGV